MYVFLKLLGDGVLYAADAKLNKKDDLYYPLVEILRTERDKIMHYVKEDVFIKIVDTNDRAWLRLPVSEFKTKAEKLLSVIKGSKDGYSGNGDTVRELTEKMNEKKSLRFQYSITTFV